MTEASEELCINGPKSNREDDIKTVEQLLFANKEEAEITKTYLEGIKNSLSVTPTVENVRWHSDCRL